MDNKTNNKTTIKNQTKKPNNKSNKLSQKELDFCRYYVETGNGIQAVKKAGYNVKNDNTAGNYSSLLLKKPKVQTEITRLRQKAETKTIATAQEVMQFFTDVMNGKIKDQFGLDASLADRTRAAQELAKRTVDIDNKIKAINEGDNTLTINLNWEK